MSTVLVVSSDAALSDNWGVALEAAGHTVLAAGMAGEGVSLLREGGIDVIVLGQPPDRELAHLVTELARLPDPPPFILVSGSPSAPEVSARVGAAAFVPQPCSAGEIVESIARFAPPGGSAPNAIEPANAPASGVAVAVEDEPTEPRRTTQS